MTVSGRDPGEPVPKPVVCLISRSKNTYSETFIRGYVDALPATVRVLYGDYLPTHQDDDTPLLLPTLPRLVRAASRRLLGLPWESPVNLAIKRFWRSIEAEAVLAEYGPTGVHVLDLCTDAGLPLIVRFHGYDAYRRDVLDRYSEGYLRLFADASAVVAVSGAMERHLLGLGAPRERLHCIPVGVDPSIFAGGNPALAPPVFVAVGRFVDKKAPHLTLLAFKKALERLPDARLAMIGDGQLWECCKQITRSLGLSNYVDFLGVRQHAEVATIMKGARAFVQHSIRTSYGDAEGTPTAVMEAAATGLPVISTRHMGIQEVVIDGVTGFLVDEGDIDGMAEAIVLVGKNPVLAAEMGAQGRQRVTREFSRSQCVERLWRVIQEAIQATGGIPDTRRSRPRPRGFDAGASC
ncbi:MAG: glycosyltransferase [Candidatus Rokuibacteriota bacterium]